MLFVAALSRSVFFFNVWDFIGFSYFEGVVLEIVKL
jgi:hypothetical protein